MEAITSAGWRKFFEQSVTQSFVEGTHSMTDQHVYSPEVIIKAYSLGLFPMADSRNSLDIKFYDPRAARPHSD